MIILDCESVALFPWFSFSVLCLVRLCNDFLSENAVACTRAQCKHINYLLIECFYVCIPGFPALTSSSY
uniref:Uncharacterized protein n=1 Tax=Rhizophora mucronata TaxID=61149 RepID=A0A2P2KWE2_RHIMU